MTADKKIAQSILLATQTVAQAGKEINAIQAELLKSLSETASFSIRSTERDTDSDDSFDEWVCWTDMSRYVVRTRGKGRGKPLGRVSYIFDIGREGGLAAGLGYACAIVAWAKEKDDPWEIDHINWPITADWEDGDTKGINHLANDRLTLTLLKGESLKAPLNEISWWYCFPLDVLQRRDDIPKYLVTPLVNLLSLESANKITQDVLPSGLTRFSEKDGIWREALPKA